MPAKKVHHMTRTAAKEAQLKRRREMRHAREIEKLAQRSASQAAEGQQDWDRLVEAETARQHKVLQDAKKGGKTPAKAISAARENLTLAFDLMGGVPGLVVWGRDNPTEFYRLWARLIPKESVEVSAQLPLKELLKKLASKESMSVGDAAYELGQEFLEQARVDAAAEDAANLARPDGETVQ